MKKFKILTCANNYISFGIIITHEEAGTGLVVSFLKHELMLGWFADDYVSMDE